jgi:hypothetical protein
VGYSLVQGFSSGSPNSAYTATFGVVNAATAMSTQWDEHPTRNRIIEIIFPVVVINGRLFQCILEKGTAEFALTEIPAASLLWRNAPKPHAVAIIDIQTAESIEAFAQRSAIDVKNLLTNQFDAFKSTIRNPGLLSRKQ